MRSDQREVLSFMWRREAFSLARRTYNASFQEVLRAIISAGLGKYCARHGHFSDLCGILPLARADSSNASFTSNRHNVGLIDLPLASTDCQHRIRKVRQGLESLKVQQNASVFPTILSSTWVQNHGFPQSVTFPILQPASGLRRPTIWNLSREPTSIVCSNVRRIERNRFKTSARRWDR